MLTNKRDDEEVSQNRRERKRSDGGKGETRGEEREVSQLKSTKSNPMSSFHTELLAVRSMLKNNFIVFLSSLAIVRREKKKVR
jgi:hypothetical protein